MLALKLPRDLARSMLARRCHSQRSHQRDAARECGKHHPVCLPAHRVAINRIAHSEAIAVRLQKTCMAQKQCRQNTSIQAMTIPALPIIT